MTETYGLLTINTVTSGTVAANLAVSAGDVLKYTATMSGTGNQWIVDLAPKQTAGPENMTLTEPPIQVLWNPIKGPTTNSGSFILQTWSNFNWNGSTITYLTDMPGFQPVAALLGLAQGSTGVHNIPNTSAYASSPGSMVTDPASWMNNFVTGSGYPASSFQLTYAPTNNAPLGLINALQAWGANTPMPYLMSCSATTNSIVNGGSCH